MSMYIYPENAVTTSAWRSLNENCMVRYATNVNVPFWRLYLCIHINSIYSSRGNSKPTGINAIVQNCANETWINRIFKKLYHFLSIFDVYCEENTARIPFSWRQPFFIHRVLVQEISLLCITVYLPLYFVRDRWQTLNPWAFIIQSILFSTISKKLFDFLKLSDSYEKLRKVENIF